MMDASGLDESVWSLLLDDCYDDRVVALLQMAAPDLDSGRVVFLTEIHLICY